MYLKVQYNNSIKPYTLTDSYNKPYIKVSNSILPLTTNTTQGLCIVVSTNNTTYRPLEYNSMSTSATYYTSGIQSNGLSSTTALTRSSTSQTIYHTCSSTSGTSYLTRSSTSGTSYLTQYGTDITVRNEAHVSDMYVYAGSHYMTRHETMTGIYKSSYYRTYTAWDGTRTYTCTCTFGTYIQQAGPYWWYMTHRIPSDMSYGNATRYIYQSDNSYYTSTSSASYSTLLTHALRSTSDYFAYAIATSTNTTYPNMLLTSWSQSTLSWGDNGGYTQYSFTYTQGYVILTTGTSYLTRSSTSATSYLTRSSTSRTEYKTRASTSGYSGVSSSSSQSSGWL